MTTWGQDTTVMSHTVLVCVCVCTDLKSRGWLCLTTSRSSLVLGDGHLEVGALEGLQKVPHRGVTLNASQTRAVRQPTGERTTHLSTLTSTSCSSFCRFNSRALRKLNV